MCSGLLDPCFWLTGMQHEVIGGGQPCVKWSQVSWTYVYDRQVCSMRWWEVGSPVCIKWAQASWTYVFGWQLCSMRWLEVDNPVLNVLRSPGPMFMVDRYAAWGDWRWTTLCLMCSDLPDLCFWLTGMQHEVIGGGQPCVKCAQISRTYVFGWQVCSMRWLEVDNPVLNVLRSPGPMFLVDRYAAWGDWRWTTLC